MRQFFKITIWAFLALFVFATACTEDATEECYVVSFETNGGSALADIQVKKNTPLVPPTDPVKEGYALEEWCSDSELTTAYNFSYSVKEDMTLYAKWIVDEGYTSTGTGKITFEYELKVTDYGMYFNGSQQTSDLDTDNDPSAFEYYFGRQITPHGDCIKKYGDFLFLTWWMGGEENKYVMLSRLHLPTQTLETIQFEHQHVGYQHKYPHIGDSHNTIAVGICPLDGTVHLLYDMHSYSKTDFPEDFFNYQVSIEGAATVDVGEFNRALFNDQQTWMNPAEDYSDFTYPSFFLNDDDELFTWTREGGNTNGAYKFAKYTGNGNWNMFTDFSSLNAKNYCDITYNWGLYGDMKYVNGKLRVGFLKRMNSSTDQYYYNNGFHYAYTNDPDGETEWYNYAGVSFDIPLYDPDKIFFFEPGSYVSTGDDATGVIYMAGGADFTVTDAESVHFITNTVKNTSTGVSVDVHAYKKASDLNFTTTTEFPGGTLYPVDGDKVFLISDTSDKRIEVSRAEGGTNNWSTLYTSSEGIQMLHYVTLIQDGKMYIYAMQNGYSGDARPIYIQVYDLGY